MEKKKKDWFQLKRYPHIGLPLNVSERYVWIEDYVKNPTKISKHSFLPFIHKTSKVRKFRKKYSIRKGTVIYEIIEGKKKSLRVKDEKKREIYYASHLDSLIYTYYAQELGEKYELKLKEYNLDDVITAYRSIPTDQTNLDKPNKCNIDFANDAFKFILNYEPDEFVVMAFDISSFFDNLDHQILRNKMMEVLEVTKLSPDYFNVFKAITRFSYVDIVDIFTKFQNEILVRKKDEKGYYKKKRISKIKYLKSQEAVAYCTTKEFFKYKTTLIKNTKNIKKENVIIPKNFGIPQGSPISSVLANLYLLDFDKKINNAVTEVGGIYRRYSDDMIIVCPKDKKVQFEQMMYTEIDNFKLEIHPKKTQIFHFKKNNQILICGQEFKNSFINWNKNFIYLGFEFDGTNALLKSASLSNYYRKMNRFVRRSKHFTNKENSKTKGLFFKRRILDKISYKGAKRKIKWKYDLTEKKYIKTDQYNWGNFLTYAYKASEIMVKNKIDGQTKRHWYKLNEMIKR
jgi:hypothetical protein